MTGAAAGAACGPARARWRARLTSLAFLVYAAALLAAARAAGHHVAAGWGGRLATMALVAAGLAPWAGWIGPRLARLLGWLGWAALAACYVTILAPFALLLRALPDPFGVRGRQPGRSWQPRRPPPSTLESARLES